MLFILDTKKYFIEHFYIISRISKFELAKIEKSAALFLGGSSQLSYSGISFRLSGKILDSFKNKINWDDPKSVLIFESCSFWHNWAVGNWGEVNEYDDNLVNKNLNIGYIFRAIVYLAIRAMFDFERGNFGVVQHKIDKLLEIADTYLHDYARAVAFRLKFSLLVECRKIYGLLNEIEESILILGKTGQEPVNFMLYIFKSRLQIILKDIDGAKESLRSAEKYLSIRGFPLAQSQFLLCQFLLYLYHLELAIATGNKQETAKIGERALKTGKKLVKISQKIAFSRTEAYKLMGTYYWLTGKQEKALRWFNKSIYEGERLGARLQLSRTYFEVGKRLLEPKSKCNELNGIKADEYLSKAKIMFEEMDLQWDLDEVAKLS